MANQDNLTFGGIGADPTGAYTQIETGWNPTYADGAVKWLPSSAAVTTAVADAGLITVGPITVTNGTGTGIATDVSGDPDLITITLTSGATMSTVDADVVIDVADADSGSFGTGVIAGGSQTPASNGVVQLTNGGLGGNWDGTVTYKENRDEAVVTNNYNPVPVAGVKHLSVYHPASGNAEVTAKFQWTDDDILSIDGVEQATWTDLTSATASAQADLVLDPGNNATWAKLDKMKYIRLVLISTDADTDGVADVSALYEHASDGAYIKYAEDRTAENNGSTGYSVGGIGADPS